jgi:hypothetical protein
MQQRILKFFADVIAGDRQTIQLINAYESGVTIKDDTVLLTFSLYGLYEILNISNNLDYNIFRKNLYQGNINEVLKKQGFSIDIHRSMGKVDDNLYKLNRII